MPKAKLHGVFPYQGFACFIGETFSQTQWIEFCSLSDFVINIFH